MTKPWPTPPVDQRAMRTVDVILRGLWFAGAVLVAYLLRWAWGHYL